MYICESLDVCVLGEGEGGVRRGGMMWNILFRVLKGFGREHVDVYMLYTCLCYMLRERKPVLGGVEELGGLFEADGAEGRRSVQQRSATPEKEGKICECG